MALRLLALLLLFTAACGDDPAWVEGARFVVEGVEPDANGFWLVDFGEVEAGSEQARTLVLRNTGGGSAQLEPSGILPPFFASIPRDRVEPGAMVELQLVFAPLLAGEREAFATVQAGTQSIDLRLRGRGIGEGGDCLELSPESIDFGTQDVGCAPWRRTLSILNGCDRATTVDVRIVEEAGIFHLLSQPSLPTVLEPGASIEVELGFTPQAAGDFRGRVGAFAEGGGTSALLLGSGTFPLPVVMEDDFPSGAFPTDLLLVIDEGAATAAHELERQRLAEFVEAMARWGEYDLRIAATGTTLEPGPGCGGRGGQLLPLGAPDVLEDASRHPEGIAERLEALLELPVCEAPAQPIEAALQAAELFVREGRASRTLIYIVSARDDEGETAVETIVDGIYRRLVGFPGIRVMGPSPECGHGEGERLASFVDEAAGVFRPICTPWVDPFEALPMWTSLEGPPGFKMPRMFYLTGTPIDRNGDGALDAEDFTVHIEGTLVPPRKEDGTPAWIFDPATHLFRFEPHVGPRRIDHVQIEYVVEGKPVCDGD